MKTKHLIWAALAFPVIFAACSNEDFITETNSPIANGKVIDGIKFTITKGEDAVNTRLNKDGWENGDIVGLAYKIGSDQNVYTNHALKYDKAGDFFASSSLIYEGEHFAYFPFDENHLSVKPLKVELAKEQTVGKENDMIWKGGFSISALEELTKKNGSGYGKNAEFVLERLTNTLQLKVKAGNVGDIVPADIKLKSVKVATNGTAPFVQSVTVDPTRLPNVVHDAESALGKDASAAEIATAKATDMTATKTEMALAGIYGASDKALNYTEAAQSIQTAISGDASIASEYPVNLLMFPTVDATSTATNLTITIVTNYGTVEIAKDDATDGTETEKAIRNANNEAIGKLAALLSGEGHTVGGKTYKLSEVNSAPLALSFAVDMTKATMSEVNIASDTELAEAIKIATNVTSVSKFNITDNVTADLSKIPANVVTIDVADGKTLKVSGEVNHNITFTATGGDDTDGQVEVPAGSTLTIDAKFPDTREVVMQNLVNWGTIEIGKYGTLTLNGTANINHSVITNKGALTLESDAALTNDKAGAAEGHPECTGKLDNYGAINGTTAVMVNKGELHQRGTIADGIKFKDNAISGSEAAVTGSIAISYNGKKLPANSGEKKQANVTTPEEMTLALGSGANTIYINGAVSVNKTLTTGANIDFVLEKETVFYIMTGAAKGDNNVNITVTGTDVKLITLDPRVYLAINNLKIEKDAKLTIGNSNDSYAKKTAINVTGLIYDGTVVNNGWVYAGSMVNGGAWSGMSANMKETSAEDATLTMISGVLSSR